VTGDRISGAREDDTAWAGRFDEHFVTSPKPRLSQGGDRDGGLVLRADPRPASPSRNLYFCHGK